MLSDGGPLGFCGGRTEHDSFDQSRKIDINKDAVFRNRDAMCSDTAGETARHRRW
ncbi:hypothetical protein [Salipiger profundus]|uniref:hypothetical protein n=1 Tax=Salipiger profundus TaxID=1229727 RepID=UPI0012FFB3B8|nr:hypothetical protein [Salipiger profundus]